jgi:glyoxylate reductase
MSRDLKRPPARGVAGRERAESRLPRLFLTRRLPDPGMSLLAEAFTVQGNLEDRALSRTEILAGVAGAEAILRRLGRIDEAVLEAAGHSLRVVSNFGAGVDSIDVSAATARGILVTNTPGVLTGATADLTWALILAAARRLIEGDSLVRQGRWQGREADLFLGVDLPEKTLGVVGMGRIGQAVARRAVGFDMRVLYTSRSGPLPPEHVPPGAQWEHRSDLDELLAQADVVTLHLPLTAETRHLIGRRELALMRPRSILVNTARGPVVDEGALVEALRAGRPAAAGLDVYEDEPRLAPGLASLQNAVLLPHLGSATEETRGRMAALAVRNAAAALRGEPVPHPVNPEVLRDGRLDIG